MIAEQTMTSQGVLELHPKGFGFLRNPSRHYAAQAGDPYVPAPLIQKHSLREGMLVGGVVEPPRKGASGPRLTAVARIEDQEPHRVGFRNWDELTPIDPHEQVVLETPGGPLTTRVMDLFTPLGKGQRGLIVAPPRTGKTVLLSHIAQAVSQNHPEMHLIMLLIDERPEEVTEMRRTVKGEVVASSSDNDAGNHVRLAELVMERAKRLAEQGRQVFVLLDSLTRLARAYNKTAGNSGRTMSGGVDSRALEVPKRLFGAARVFEEGGSITVIGSCLVETGSRMDDVIFEEFKGTGNMELILDRAIADRRIFPAVDVLKSGTRREELLCPPEELKQRHLLRRALADLSTVEATQFLIDKLQKTQSNPAFLSTLVAPAPVRRFR